MEGPSSSERGRRYTDHRALREAATRECKKRFNASVGRDFGEADRRFLRGDLDPEGYADRERRARELFSEVRSSLRKVSKFVQSEPNWFAGYECAAVLRLLCWELIDPLLQTSPWKYDRVHWAPTLLPDAPRTALVVRLYEHEGLRLLGVEKPRRRDWITLSILAGNFPEITAESDPRDGLTVSDALELEGRALKQCLVRVKLARKKRALVGLGKAVP
jgi:hypothetical protein